MIFCYKGVQYCKNSMAPSKEKRDRRIDDEQSDPCEALCFAGMTKIVKHLCPLVATKFKMTLTH